YASERPRRIVDTIAPGMETREAGTLCPGVNSDRSTADKTNKGGRMKNRRNYYRILQVQPDAPQAVIRASYKALMRELKLHPDLGGDHWNATVLNDAYTTLGDPDRRAAYDKKLFERYTTHPFDADKEPVISYFCPFCKRPLARQADPEETCPSCRSPLASDGGAHREQDQRAIERLRKSGQIRFYKDWPLKPSLGEIVDLSPEGMRFQCRDQLMLQVTIKISSRDLQAVAVVQNISRLVERGKILYIVGVQFLSVQFSQPKGSFYSTSA
ncbi:MAG: J domain-containing protein, partial [Candidatus Tectomicrobia bacterium]